MEIFTKGSKKVCRSCGDSLTKDNWTMICRLGKHYQCLRCFNKLPRAFRLEIKNAYNESKRAKRFRIKWEAMQALGGATCACCGETDFKFLTIDHIDGGGRRDLKRLSGGNLGVYRRIVKHHSATSKSYRVLCWNCNCGRSQNGGLCPHKDPARRKLGSNV